MPLSCAASSASAICFESANVSSIGSGPRRVPELHGKLASSHYVFCWDERRRTGYLLVAPHTTEEQELRFHVSWKKPGAGWAWRRTGS